MKTKTNPQSKILIVFAAILCCIVSTNSFGQNAIIPIFQDFHGTWVGTNVNGIPVEITLTSDWKCTFNTANNLPMHSDNPVVAYRMPQYFPKTLADNGPPTSPEITIKFYTQNAMSGILVARNSTNTPSVGDNSVNTNMIEQVYIGLALLSQNTSGQMEMELYLDAVNYQSAPPVLSSAPDANNVPYCVLVKQ